MLEIDGRYKSMVKQDRGRVEQWVSCLFKKDPNELYSLFLQSKVLCQANSSLVWKKNRNLYAMQLLDCVLNDKLVKPYSQPPPARASKNQNVN